ncbi:formyl-CoA transferase [Pokkaliibacter plantistimulans]|uniref:Formyl-CoA transferase n=1 Tax=Proteobacteria bacterium 228 TaxID=2083153 RepID=A0A2S5KJ97_9PROT|nr:CaiB/BaiF CoA-transferase family protein [Pokkaliibacter plantistimulans]PPC74705.1 formyl-CoA transferase [Pokkaliibacter plantistimulans]
MVKMNSTDQTDIRPLSGVKVLDFTQALSGPYCTMMLADAGAEIFKVEPVEHGDHVRDWRYPGSSMSPYFLAANRSKKSAAIDLKSPRGKALALALAKECDIIVENFRPGVMTRLGLSPEVIRAVNPRVIFCSISGFGQNGPLASRPAYDLIASGYGGSMSVTGDQGGMPCKLGIPAADIMGAMSAAYSIMLALKQREKTGEGQHLDISMVDTQISAMAYHLLNYQMTGSMPVRMGSANPLMSPYQSFETADQDINLGVLNERQWAAFCVALDEPEWRDDPRFNRVQARLKNRKTLCEMISLKLKTNNATHWLERLSTAGVPCGPIRTVQDLVSDHEMDDRKILVDVELDGKTIRVPGAPWKGIGVKASDTLPPQLGSSTHEVLATVLGLSTEEIGSLEADGVIACQA